MKYSDYNNFFQFKNNTLFVRQNPVILIDIIGDIEKEQKIKLLEKHISEIFYSQFYVNPNHGRYGKKNLFKSLLKNNSYLGNKLIRGFKIISKSNFGQIIIQKENTLRIAYPGEYITINDNECIYYQKKVILNPKDIFCFYIPFSEISSYPEFLNRLYFNINPDYLHIILVKIFELMHSSVVPFNLKFLTNRKDYWRSDTLVIYFFKDYSSEVFQLFEENYFDLKDFLRLNIPLFTNELMPGISWAENPPTSNMSFGQQISIDFAKQLVKTFKI